MRLLNTDTLKLEEFFDSEVPEYAILSHRWGKEEVSLQELMSEAETMKSKAGYTKIQNFCALAKRNGHKYGWVDTCNIDKSSSAELSEAINSMFRWYRKAQICYAYLDDVEEAQCWVDDGPNTFAKSLWFTRGWTLQELLAPTKVEFYAKGWIALGAKRELSTAIAEITLIDISAIGCFEASQFSVAQRISWASMRTTTRREDEAYCLLGILEVHMPLLYGEGANAFRRLQEEVIKTSADQSILAWTSEALLTGREAMSPLAESPRQFVKAGQIVSYPDDDIHSNIGSLAVINNSLQITLPLVQWGSYDVHGVLACRYRDNSDGPLGIAMLHQGTNYARFWHAPVVVPLHCVATAPRKTICIDPSIPSSLRYNASPSGFVIVSSSSPRSFGLMPVFAYPNELWNPLSRTFNFSNLGPPYSVESAERFALTLFDGKHRATFLLGFWNSEEAFQNSAGVRCISSRTNVVWCDVVEAATEDDIKKVWEVATGPSDEVWDCGLKIRRIGWQATWTVSILPKRLMGESVWVVTFERSDLSEEPAKEDFFCRTDRVESFPTLRLRTD